MPKRKISVIGIIGVVAVIGCTTVFLASPSIVAAGNNNQELIHAAAAGNLGEVKRLLDAGTDVNAKDIDGSTALMWASRRDHPEVVRLLLARGANVNAKTKDGKTALNVASAAGHSEVIKLLKARRATVLRCSRRPSGCVPTSYTQWYGCQWQRRGWAYITNMVPGYCVTASFGPCYLFSSQ